MWKMQFANLELKKLVFSYTGSIEVITPNNSRHTNALEYPFALSRYSKF